MREEAMHAVVVILVCQLLFMTGVAGYTLHPSSFREVAGTLEQLDEGNSVCQDDQSGDLHLSGIECGNYYVECRGGSPVYAQLCPGGTAYDTLRQACYDLYQCNEHGHEPLDDTSNTLNPSSSDDSMWTTYEDNRRSPRKVNFLEGDYNSQWMAMRKNAAQYRQRRQATYDRLPTDNTMQTRTSRQIKFFAIPDRELPASDDSEYRRQITRQVKFRSVDDDLGIKFGRQEDKNSVAKKHTARQVKFRSLHSGLLYPTLSRA